MVKRGVFFIFILVVCMQIVAAHAEHAKPSIEKTSVWYQVFLIHDWIHPIFFLLMVYSCYYVRFFSGRRISRQPSKCLADCSDCYKPEGWLKQRHRYFFWGTFILTFIHIGEIGPSLSTITKSSGLDLWITISEGVYLVSAILYLVTCYHFRYFIERLAHKRWISYSVYNRLTSLNQYHNAFFWSTIIPALMRFVLVAVDTNSILKAIPGTF